MEVLLDLILRLKSATNRVLPQLTCSVNNSDKSIFFIIFAKHVLQNGKLTFSQPVKEDYPQGTVLLSLGFTCLYERVISLAKGKMCTLLIN